MKPDPSNPFLRAQSDSSGQPENPFEQAARQAQAPSPFQSEEPNNTPPIKLPERRDQDEDTPSPFSIDVDPSPEAGEPSPIRLSEPVEGFATPVREADIPKPPREVLEVVEENPFVMPAPFEQPKSLAEAEVSVPSNPAPDSRPVDERQLVLRAIFGVAHNLDRNEILKKASSLPGIISVQALGRAECAALGVLLDGIKRLDQGADLKLVSSQGSVELIKDGATTLFVLHEGVYRPGVREILTIVARELSQVD
ncbi:MAG: hypothetical protein ABF391_13905 [Akkermansiaceae bacterium]